jgi:hypothetical protein
LAVGLAVVMGVGLVGYGAKVALDMKAALAPRDRPRQPWEVEY